MIHVNYRPPGRPTPHRKHLQQLLFAALGIGLLWRAGAATFAEDLANSEIHTRGLRGNLHVLVGFGGNITVSTGPDGTLLVDDEYAALTSKVRAALAELRSPPVKLVVNTHWHDDHTGGNEAFARDGALIIAQENAGRRMRSDEIVSLGYRPPYFDDLNGGSLHGMVAAADTLLKLVDDRTIVVPGHGDVSEDQVVALHPTDGFAKPGRGTDRWVRVVYREYRRGVDATVPASPNAANGLQPVVPAPDEPFVFETWSKQKLAAFRGSFTVPENRKAKDSRSISIAYVRLPATTRTPGPPIIYLAGGPGGSGIQAINYRTRLLTAMRAYGDVIALDQRGTGASNIVPECHSTQVMPTDRAISDRLFTEHFRNALRECLVYWRAQGVDLNGYNTVENALDLEALRTHLGADKLVLLGTSYGSTLALEALRQMPDRIERVILSSVRGTGQTMKLPARADEYVARLQQAVDSQPATKTVYPDIAALMRRVHAKLARAPAQVELKSPRGTTARYLLQEHDMQLLAGSLIADPDTAALLLPIYRALDEGSDPGLDQIPSRFLPDYLAAPGEPISLDGMSVAVNISSGMTARRRVLIFEQANAAILGRYLDHLLLAFDGVAPELDIGDALRENPRSNVPVLMFSGTLDGRTDIADQREAVTGLENVSLITVKNAGHNLFDDPTPQMLDAIRRFMTGLPVHERTISVALPDFAPAPAQDSSSPSATRRVP